jgi:hypothetical protein
MEHMPRRNHPEKRNPTRRKRLYAREANRMKETALDPALEPRKKYL